MSKPILIVYGSWAGSTRDVAEFIGQELGSRGLECQVENAGQVASLNPYGGVIMGSGIRAGRFHPGLVRFGKKYKSALTTLPVALFVVCLTMQDDNEENRCKVMEYIRMFQQKLPGLNPVSMGLFGGMMDYDNFKGIMKRLVKAMKIPPGDHRDWNAIKAWTISLVPLLTT